MKRKIDKNMMINVFSIKKIYAHFEETFLLRKVKRKKVIYITQNNIRFLAFLTKMGQWAYIKDNAFFFYFCVSYLGQRTNMKLKNVFDLRP